METAVPLKSAVEVLTKFVPVSVMGVSGSPAVADVWLRLVSVGAGLLTVNVSVFDVPPPGLALTTVIGNMPAVVRSAAGTTTSNSVALTNVVETAVPLKSAVEVLTKFVPVSVMGVSGSPTVADVWLRLVSVGAGLLTVNVSVFDVPPPGLALTTVIGNMPAVVRSAAGTTTSNSVALTNVVETAVPLKSAVEVLTKFVPVSVMGVSGSPTVADVWLRLVSVGAGLLTVNVSVFDVPPPGLALTTVIGNMPAVVRSAAGTTTSNSVGADERRGDGRAVEVRRRGADEVCSSQRDGGVWIARRRAGLAKASKRRAGAVDVNVGRGGDAVHRDGGTAEAARCGSVGGRRRPT